MRRVFAWLALMAIALSAGTASAQLDDDMRTTTRTVAEIRLSDAEKEQLRVRAAQLARENSLQFSAVQRLAEEIDVALPEGEVTFEQYIACVENGVVQLRTFLADAKARRDAHPELAEALNPPIAAAEQGQVQEARAQYDALLTPMLSQGGDSTSISNISAYFSESARLSLALSDYADAAARYAQAADYAPAGSVERAEYKAQEGETLRDHATQLGDLQLMSAAVDAFEGAVATYRDGAAIATLSAPVPSVAAPEAPAALMTDAETALPTELTNALADAAEEVVAEAPAVVAAVRPSAPPVRVAVVAPASARPAQSAPPPERDEDDVVYDGAIAALRAALRARSREQDPMGWALAQSSLGDAYLSRGARGDGDALRSAEAAYRAAQEVRTKDADPRGWAETQLSFGEALRLQGENGDISATARAIEAFRDALDETTRGRDPQGWAKGKCGLASALLLQGVRGDSQALDLAWHAYDDALSVTTRSRDPQGWAQTQTFLAVSLLFLGRRTHDHVALRRALSALEEALEIRRREINPQGFASSTYYLALVHRAMGRRSDARRAANNALTAFQQVGNTIMAERTQTLLQRLER